MSDDRTKSYIVLFWEDWSETPDEDVGKFSGPSIADRSARYFTKQEAEDEIVRLAKKHNRTAFAFKIVGSASMSTRIEMVTT